MVWLYFRYPQLIWRAYKSLENYSLRDKLSNGDDKHVNWNEDETILFLLLQSENIQYELDSTVVSI